MQHLKLTKGSINLLQNLFSNKDNSVYYREESDCTKQDQTSCGSVSEESNSGVAWISMILR